MARGLIPIKTAQEISEKTNAPIILIFAIHPDRQNYTITTYGQTKKLCKLAALYGENFSRALWNSVAEAVQVEPEHLPESPTQLAGEFGTQPAPGGAGKEGDGP